MAEETNKRAEEAKKQTKDERTLLSLAFRLRSMIEREFKTTRISGRQIIDAIAEIANNESPKAHSEIAREFLRGDRFLGDVAEYLDYEIETLELIDDKLRVVYPSGNSKTYAAGKIAEAVAALAALDPHTRSRILELIY